MKTKLLRNTLLALTLTVSTVSFGQLDFTFDTDAEGFTVNGPGASGMHDATAGILTGTPGATAQNIQFRRNLTDIGDPATTMLTTVLLDLKNNTTANTILLQTGSTTVAQITISAMDATEQSYQIDVTGAPATWTGEFQFRLRVIESGGGILGGNIEINRIQIVDPASLSVKNNTLEGVNVYPNPAKDVLRINTLQGGDVKLFNILGALVKSQSEVSREHTMNVSNLNAGVYILRIESENKFFTQKVIID